MKHAAQTRRELAIRTAFNLLGPLTNPAGARRQIVGVPRPDLADLLARALSMLGSERAWVLLGTVVRQSGCCVGPALAGLVCAGSRGGLRLRVVR